MFIIITRVVKHIETYIHSPHQGTALYKSLKSRGFNAALYEFPDGGHRSVTGGGVSEEGFMFERSIEWIWRYSPSIKFYDDCMEDLRVATQQHKMTYRVVDIQL